MPYELGLRFDDPAHVVLSLNDDGQIQSAPAQPFTGPLNQEAQRDLQWYLEVYPVQYTTELDDDRAAEIAQRIQGWGEALFSAVFADREAQRLFNRFQDDGTEGRLLTVSSAHPTVLAQPWELLRDPKGTYLFLDKPRISVRRQVAGAGRRPFKAAPKERLHLLFMVSRPKDAGFIDPRADPQAVMDAIEAEAPGRVSYEFLRPATVAALIRRLGDKRLPPIDVLHFDGHGVYDSDGGLTERAKQATLASAASGLLREAAGAEGPQGYLLFEKEDGNGAPVAADKLGDLLNREQVGLIVLSACQSATVGGEDPMGSVAARLIDAGVPSVLAMTHSVLVDTTRALFGHFYRELARGESIGAALDNARSQLYAQPARGERQRAEHRITLELQDWFLPALYQAGADTSLLTQAAPGVSASAVARSNLRPRPESGFHGRRRELWDIERWFVGGTRRVVVNGFGGQGKTSLAEETGRWLPRTGMFSCACFVGYAAFQGRDPVGMAVSTLGTLLGQSLLDADAATDALKRTPTLVTLDNLEALDRKALDELLTAAAVWSEAGMSRVLITTRSNDLHHVSYPTKDSNLCRYLVLQGLAPDDAVDWFQALMRLPPEPRVPLPEREPLKNLFAKVSFHPLSVGMLARQLKLRRIAELGERLEALLLSEHGDPLLASLNLSLERLDPQSTQSLPHLGVLQGGALENVLRTVCDFEEVRWLPLRQGLEQTGLLQAENLPGVGTSFLRFHPTLAPALWVRVPADEQARLAARHREAYYALSMMLYQQDSKAVAATRTIAWEELPNLLAAVHSALDAGVPWGGQFANIVGMFLNWYDLRHDQAALNERAKITAGQPGSDNWYLAQSAHGEALFQAGHSQEAANIFIEILAHLGQDPSYRRCLTLGRLGRCYRSQQHPTQAEVKYRQALAERGRLEQTEIVRRLSSYLHADLGDALLDLGRYQEARRAHESALAISKEEGDDRAEAVSIMQLGSIALEEGNLSDAESRYKKALETFRPLGEKTTEATAWHQLGIVYSRGSRFDEAEYAFRESARIKENIGNRIGLSNSWQELAQVIEKGGRSNEAEAWYLKALTLKQSVSDRTGEATTRSNLAHLLAKLPGRLTDAKAHAEEALAIKRTLDPAAARIWQTYSVLADIADQQGDANAARTLRREAQTSYAATSIAQHALRRQGPIIIAVVQAAADPSARGELDAMFVDMTARGWTSLVGAFRRILDGERDEHALCKSLDREDSTIVNAVLRGIADPATLNEIASAERVGDASEYADLHARLEPHLPLVSATVAAITRPQLRSELDPLLDRMRQGGWDNLVGAVRRILDGERTADTLIAGLDDEHSLIIRAILTAVSNPPRSPAA